MQWDTLWIHLRLATMAAAHGSPYGTLPEAGADCALAIRDGKIAWLGRMAELPDYDLAQVNVIDGGGRWMTPGLIDCHTHLVYGGNRAEEFELRLSGVNYEEIARRGGGILSTVKATRAASAQHLFETAARRLQHFLDEGVTGIEIKSGYGLDRETEVKMLQVARRLGQQFPVSVRTTFLGAHTLAPEFDDADAYIEHLVAGVLPQIVELELADAVDIFCEGIGFDLAQTETLLRAAQAQGLAIKIHAEQLSNLGGTALAAGLGALSADHLEYLDEAGVAAMAAAGTVAVLLPGAFYFLRETQLPPIDALRQAGVPIAIASDCNPGSSPAESLLLMLNMACTLFHLTPEEALAGVTREAARALGWEEQRGTLEVGKRADLVLWDIDHPAELAYYLGRNPCHQVVLAGQAVLENA
ncbi:MAG: imidazolonepropionase [Halieaceae bacterium]